MVDSAEGRSVAPIMRAVYETRFRILLRGLPNHGQKLELLDAVGVVEKKKLSWNQNSKSKRSVPLFAEQIEARIDPALINCRQLRVSVKHCQDGAANFGGVSADLRIGVGHLRLQGWCVLHDTGEHHVNHANPKSTKDGDRAVVCK